MADNKEETDVPEKGAPEVNLRPQTMADLILAEFMEWENKMPVRLEFGRNFATATIVEVGYDYIVFKVDEHLRAVHISQIASIEFLEGEALKNFKENIVIR